MGQTTRLQILVASSLPLKALAHTGATVSPSLESTLWRVISQKLRMFYRASQRQTLVFAPAIVSTSNPSVLWCPCIQGYLRGNDARSFEVLFLDMPKTALGSRYRMIFWIHETVVFQGESPVLANLFAEKSSCNRAHTSTVSVKTT